MHSRFSHTLLFFLPLDELVVLRKPCLQWQGCVAFVRTVIWAKILTEICNYILFHMSFICPVHKLQILKQNTTSVELQPLIIVSRWLYLFIWLNCCLIFFFSLFVYSIFYKCCCPVRWSDLKLISIRIVQAERQREAALWEAKRSA